MKHVEEVYDCSVKLQFYCSVDFFALSLSLSHFVLFIFNVSRLQLQFMRWLSHHDLWNEINWIAIKYLHGTVIVQVTTNAFCYGSLSSMCLIKIDFEKDLMKSPHAKVIEYFVKYVGIYPNGVIWGNAILKIFNWKVWFHYKSIYQVVLSFWRTVVLTYRRPDVLQSFNSNNKFPTK